MYGLKPSDKSLASDIQKGGAIGDKAQADLYKGLKLEKYGRIKARQLFVPKHEVLDFVHGAFIVLIKKIKAGDFQASKGSIKSYYLAILDRMIKNENSKHHHRQSLLQVKPQAIEAADFSATIALEKEDFEKRAMDIFSQLGEVCQKIYLYSYRGYKPRQIAGILGWGKTEGQRVSQKKRSCREALRKKFPAYFNELVQLRKEISHGN